MEEKKGEKICLAGDNDHQFFYRDKQSNLNSELQHIFEAVMEQTLRSCTVSNVLILCYEPVTVHAGVCFVLVVRLPIGSVKCGMNQ